MNHLKVFFTRKNCIAIGVAFFSLGFLFGNWATMIPYVKYTYNLSDGALGLVLLCMPLGCVMFNFFAALMIQKWGKLAMTIAGMILLSLTYALPLSFHQLWVVPIGLFLIGMVVTLINIAMNMTATDIEKTEGIYIMSTCHGMFSLGLMVGSLMRTITYSNGITEPQHMFIMCGIVLIAALSVTNIILKIETSTPQNISQEEKLKLSWPTGALLMMIIISLCTNVTEGTMADWSTLYMKDIVKAPELLIGWGLSSYSAMMALGRFMGDAWIPRFGKNNILVWGAFCTIVGFMIAIIYPSAFPTIAGFGFVGLGVSLGSPILYGSAARYPDIPHGGGLALMNTFSMGGFLAGPVVIGFISDISNLAVAFGCVVILGILWAYKARRAVLY